jgi:hypothetical protein
MLNNPPRVTAVVWPKNSPGLERLELPPLYCCPQRDQQIGLGNRVFTVRAVVHYPEEHRIELRLYEE